MLEHVPFEHGESLYLKKFNYKKKKLNIFVKYFTGKSRKQLNNLNPNNPKDNYKYID